MDTTAPRPLAVVTGASSGIGYHLACCAAEKGYDLVVAADMPLDDAVGDFQALGAATQQINFSELYVALQQGVVDGQENPLANIHSSKLHEVNRFISLTSHKWECSPFLASRIAWGRLSEADRKLITEVGREATEHNRQLMQESDARLLAEYRASPAVAVNEAEQPLFRAATAPVINTRPSRL